ncbi:MAG: methylmalonyl-CoA mutase, partial [Armatimonadetes bacterium]|nr:methylmalonyl-CoA mutase [Armatimonadota bacterium]
SYYVESLTTWMEAQATEYFKRIQTEGGVLDAIRSGFFQKEIGRAAYEFQRQVDRKDRLQVGVNDFVDTDEKIEIPVLKIDPEIERRQAQRTQNTRRTRDNEKVRAALGRLTEGCRGSENLMPLMLDAVRAYATLGEMVEAMREVFGGYREPAIF